MKPGPLVYGPKGEQIADTRPLMDEDEAMANARLIAAAPDLLYMLELALPSVEEADEFNKPTAKLAPIIRALIAKATA